MRLEMNIFSID